MLGKNNHNIHVISRPQRGSRVNHHIELQLCVDWASWAVDRRLMNRMDRILQGLNAAQSAAVTSTAPVLQVLAPPGSGKTKTLTARVAYLLAYHGYKPWNVICCTFTIKASREMRERLRSLIGEGLESKLLLGTFHSVCRRYLASYGHLIGIPKDFGIADSSASSALLTRIVKQLKVSLEPKSVRARISRCKAKAQGLHGRLESRRSKKPSLEDQEFSQVYEEYQNSLAASSLLDYDDLLLRCVELLRGHPECVSNIEAVLIDEFQDTNTVQLELMHLLATKQKRVTIVGDPDQSIYGFRSAEIKNLTRMQQYYPDTSVIHLEQNYRSSAAVLRCSQDVIEQDTARPNKSFQATHCYGTPPVLRKLPSAHDEANWIVCEIKRIKAMTGKLINLSDYAILIRSAHLSLLIENALTKAGMRYRMVGGYRFFDREEIRTLLDYLKIISQPNNNAALCAVINVPARKLGEESIKELLRVADEKGISLWAVIQKVTRGDLTLKKRLKMSAEQNLCKLISLIKEAKNGMAGIPAESTPIHLLEFYIKRLAYKEYLRSKHPDDHENRWTNVEELLGQAADMARSGSSADANSLEKLPELEGVEQRQLDGNAEALASFLANITLSSDLQATDDGQEQDCVTISTIHSAKGLEWPVVFIPAVFEGSIPHSRAEDTDEERRLLYVAMTRAQALLYLTFPLRQPRGDVESTLTSFLPPKTQRRFVQLGPDITHKSARDIALILGRTPPSPEDIHSGIESLSERDSTQDSLWPADGSAKPRQWPVIKDENHFLRKTPVQKVTGQEALNTPEHHIPGSQARKIVVETTMTSWKSSTTVTAPAGFSTAAQHLEVSRSRPIEDKTIEESGNGASQPEDTVSKTKKWKAKATTGQHNLANFFSRGSFVSLSSPSHSEAAAMLEPELPSFASSHEIADSGPATLKIPLSFTTHKLSARPTSLKRPLPLQDIPNAKRQQYVFLSSSPVRDGHTVEAAGYKVEAKVLMTANEKTNRAIPTFRTATTTHTTSMDAVHRQNTVGVRKTYGVRRMMNGWENRKNR